MPNSPQTYPSSKLVHGQKMILPTRIKSMENNKAHEFISNSCSQRLHFFMETFPDFFFKLFHSFRQKPTTVYSLKEYIEPGSKERTKFRCRSLRFRFPLLREIMVKNVIHNTRDDLPCMLNNIFIFQNQASLIIDSFALLVHDIIVS